MSTHDPFAPDYKNRLEACLLHFNFDLAAVVRFIGGQHTGAHRDPKAIRERLTQLQCDPRTIQETYRILKYGTPKQVNAHSTETNYQTFKQYGNHSSISQEPAKTAKAMTKEGNREYVVVFDHTLADLIPHTHLTPIGIVDLDHNYRKPRIIFDASFLPTIENECINDWTDPNNEPPIAFLTAKLEFFQWLWNL